VGHVPPPHKKIMKTRKNENTSKLREQPFAEEFSEMGVWVVCLVGRCRERLLLSGTKKSMRKYDVIHKPEVYNVSRVVVGF